MLHVQTTLAAQFLPKSALRTHTAFSSCSQTQPRTRRSCCNTAWEEIQPSAVHPMEPLAENTHLPATRLPYAVRSILRCPHSPYRWRWWICRTDPSLEPTQSPTEKQGAKVSTKCYSGLEDSASAQPAGWKEPVTSKEGQQEDRRGTKGALMEFNNSPADRLELDL